MIRSWLFVPGDSPRKFDKASRGPADALILDLEDSVSLAAKPAARHQTCAMLKAARGGQRLYVRVNAFDSGLLPDDLAAVIAAAPDGLVLPKCESAAQVANLSQLLDGAEAGAGIAPGATRIVAIVTETPLSLFGLGDYRHAGPRLHGMMWGAEDLAAELGALGNSEGDRYTEPFRLARSLCLAGARAAGVAAIDAVCADVRNLRRVADEAHAARRDGFDSKAVIHPDHVPLVNSAFTPGEAEIAHARRVIRALADSATGGVVMLDGRMIDRPHERQARRVLELARAAGMPGTGEPG